MNNAWHAFVRTCIVLAKVMPIAAMQLAPCHRLDQVDAIAFSSIAGPAAEQATRFEGFLKSDLNTTGIRKDVWVVFLYMLCVVVFVCDCFALDARTRPRCGWKW